MSRLLLVSVVWCVGCNGTASRPAEATPLEIGTQFKVKIEVRGASVPAATEHEQRIAAAGNRRDPKAKVAVVGRARTTDNGGDAVYLVTIEHASTYAAGGTLRQIAADAKTALDEGARDRHTQATFDIHPGERHLDFEVAIGTPPKQQITRARMFVVGGRLLEFSCQVSLGSFASSLATCVLPDAPADAAPVDQLIGAQPR